MHEAWAGQDGDDDVVGLVDLELRRPRRLAGRGCCARVVVLPAEILGGFGVVALALFGSAAAAAAAHAAEHEAQQEQTAAARANGNVKPGFLVPHGVVGQRLGWREGGRLRRIRGAVEGDARSWKPWW